MPDIAIAGAVNYTVSWQNCIVLLPANLITFT